MRILVLGDTHITTNGGFGYIEYLGRVERRVKPDVTIWIGDCADMDSVNSHIENWTARAKSKPCIDEDLKSLREAFRAYKSAAHNRKVPRKITLGNHDWQWLVRFEDKVPETKGTYTGAMLGLLNEVGIEPTLYGDWLDVGGVLFTHIPIVGGKRVCGHYAEERVLGISAQSVVFGHSHRFKAVTAGKIGIPHKLWGINVGCSMPYGLVKEYADHGLNDWTWGVTVLEVGEGGKIKGVHWEEMGVGVGVGG